MQSKNEKKPKFPKKKMLTIENVDDEVLVMTLFSRGSYRADLLRNLMLRLTELTTKDIEQFKKVADMPK